MRAVKLARLVIPKGAGKILSAFRTGEGRHPSVSNSKQEDARVIRKLHEATDMPKCSDDDGRRPFPDGVTI